MSSSWMSEVSKAEMQGLITADMSNVQLILKYLTGRRTVPNVMADFESLGGADEVELLDGEGVLRRKVENNPHLQALRDAEGIVKLED